MKNDNPTPEEISAEHRRLGIQRVRPDGIETLVNLLKEAIEYPELRSARWFSTPEPTGGCTVFLETPGRGGRVYVYGLQFKEWTPDCLPSFNAEEISEEMYQIGKIFDSGIEERNFEVLQNFEKHFTEFYERMVSLGFKQQNGLPDAADVINAYCMPFIEGEQDAE